MTDHEDDLAPDRIGAGGFRFSLRALLLVMFVSAFVAATASYSFRASYATGNNPSSPTAGFWGMVAMLLVLMTPFVLMVSLATLLNLFDWLRRR